MSNPKETLALICATVPPGREADAKKVLRNNNVVLSSHEKLKHIEEDQGKQFEGTVISGIGKKSQAVYIGYQLGCEGISFPGNDRVIFIAFKKVEELDEHKVDVKTYDAFPTNN